MNMMTVESDFTSFNQSIMAMNSHDFVVLRDRESENFSMNFIFTLHKFEKFYNTAYSHGHTVSILFICDINNSEFIFRFACETWEKTSSTWLKKETSRRCQTHFQYEAPIFGAGRRRTQIV